MISPRVEDVLSALETATSTEELRVRMQTAVQNYGFAGYDFIDAADPHSGVKPFHFGTAERAWEDTYVANNFVELDPCIAKCQRTNIPFTWEEVAPGVPRPGPKSPIRRLMDAAQDFGLNEGLVVPCHFRDELGRMHSVSSVFFWKDRVQGFRAVLSNARRAELHLVMIYFIQRCIDLKAEEIGGEAKLLREIRPEQAEDLTVHQRDVLAWAARGKTVEETAEIMGISDMTVRTHMRNALRRLGVSGKTHGVAKAIKMGLINY
jgi:LuxR family quorum sensing-dependent transcriptional regulator